MIVLRHNFGIREAQLEIPGWAGRETEDVFQPWHLTSFQESQHLEILWTGEDVVIDEPFFPFYALSGEWFGVKTSIEIETPENHSLLIFPHPQVYYTPEAPLALVQSLRLDWYVCGLELIFKKKTTVFKKDEPVASAIVVKRDITHMVKFSESEEQIRKSKRELEIEDLITRKWETKDGTPQDNLYNVLCHLDDTNRLPPKLKPKPKKHRMLVRK